MTIDELHKNTIANGLRLDLDRQFAELATGPDFGILSEDAAQGCGLSALPIRISHGEHRGHSNGYGIRHILLGHGEELAKQNWYSVQDFVLCVIDEFDSVFGDDDRPNRWHLVRRAQSRTDVHWILVIEIDETNGFYRVITGWTREGHRRFKNALLWERRDRSPRSG